MAMPMRLLTLLIATTLAASGLSAGELLTMKFREGETFGYVFQQDLDAVTSAQGQELQMKLGQKLNVSTQINSVDEDGKAKAEQTIKRVRFKMELSKPAEKTIEFDSASEEVIKDQDVARLAANLAKTVDQPIGMTIAPNGEMTDIVIPEIVRESQQAPGAPGGGDSLEQTFQQSGIRLPTKEVSKGDTWEQTMEMKQQYGTMIITTTYTYQGKDDDGLHKIDATMDFTLEPPENSPIKVTITPKEATGSFLFDNEAGRLTKSAVTQILEVNAEGAFKQTITTRVLMTVDDGSEDAADEASPEEKE